MNALAKFHRVLTLDVRGHGRSRPAGEHSFAAVVDDAFALLDAVQGVRAVVIGLSMGGNVAQEMVFRDPLRFDGVVCADCTCNTLVPVRDRLLAPVYQALLQPLLALQTPLAFARRVAEASATTESGKAYVRAATAQLSRDELAHVTKTLMSALHHERGYRIEIPELLCLGAGDRLGNIRRVMPMWRARDPRSELVVIPDASHCSNLDNPEGFNQVVLDWLDRLHA